MRFIIVLPLLFIAFSVISAQQINVSGLWRGTITQNEGGYRPKYDFEIFLNQKGNKLSGRSYVFIENIYAVLELTGEITGSQTIQIKETRIVDSKKTQGLEWCIKSYNLTFSKSGNKLTLSGSWFGHTNGVPCVPGVVSLSKKFARA